MRLQFRQDLDGGLDAVARVLLETTVDQTRHVARDVRTSIQDRPGAILQDRRHERGRRIAAKRPCAGRHLVQHDAQREDVGPRIERFGFDLFGRHVRHRAQDRARLRERAARLVRVDASWLRLGGPGQAEVQHLDASIVRDHDVGGLEVAVSEVLPMRRRKCIGQRDRDVEELRQRDAALRYQLVERAPLDQLHGHEPDAVSLLGREDRDDVRMIEGGNGTRLAFEAKQQVRIARHACWQDFDGDLAPQLRVPRAIHLAHAAGAERGDDFVGTDAKTRCEDGVRSRRIHRRRLGEGIGKHGLAGDGQPIEEADVRGVRRQQRLDFTTQRRVVTSRRGQKGVALVGRPFHSSLEQRLHSRPWLVGHGRTSEPSSRLSHAFAVRQSRLAVDGDTLSTCAASSIVSPPNARSSTILASSASTVSKRSSA